MLLTNTLNQLHCPFKLSGGTYFILERRIGILFLGADVFTAVNGPLQRCGIKRKVNLQNTRLHVDLCNLLSAVMEAVRGPADAVLRSLVGKQCIFNITVVFLDVGTCLNQLCLKALPVVRHNVATGNLVKADDTLVPGKMISVGIILLVVHIVVGILVNGGILKLVVIVRIVVIVIIGGYRRSKGRNGIGRLSFAILSSLPLGGLRQLQLSARANLIVKQIHQLFHYGIVAGTRFTRGCFFINFLNRFGNHLFHNLIGLCSVGKCGSTFRALRSCGGNNSHLRCLHRFVGSLVGVGNLRRILCVRSRRIIQHCEGILVLRVGDCGVSILTLLLAFRQGAGILLRCLVANILGNRFIRRSIRLRYGIFFTYCVGNHFVTACAENDQQYHK